VRIAVITPSLNQAAFLRQCIDSVLGQRYPRLQYVVCDGGSTDGSVEILRGYGDALRWHSGPDAGQSAAINAGFRETEGDIVAWLNSDDYYLPGALEAVVGCFAANPRAAMVYGRAIVVDRDGRALRAYPTFRFARRHLKRKCYVCQPAVFVRREVLEAVGGLNEHLDICLDYEWWLRIGSRHELAFCDRVLAASRHYRATKTATRRGRALIEAGYLMRRHFGRASWRWSAKWIVHRWTLDHARFVVPGSGWWAALRSARRYRRRFDARVAPSPFGRKMLACLGPPT
jgi:glycosyltransferase involved in cell wall biosynthesis